MVDEKPFEAILTEWADVTLHRAMQGFWRFSREAGMSMPQMQTLMRLHYHGECNVSEVGSHLEISNAAASQLIQRLVEDGLLARNEGPDDRRTKVLGLTPAGRDLVQAAIATRHAWMTALAGSLDEDEKGVIGPALARLVAAARRQEEPASN
ncbi:MAG: MarR family transcriptional regulator [Chloroflexi bacterium]|nr:MarR family transcriptional regulator [Chloroflexota bacterium]